MKLIYRGVSYDYEPLVVETTTGEIGGKYRGLDWRFRNLKNSPILQPRVNLTYRGVKYGKPGAVGRDTVVEKKSPAISTQDKARVLMMQHTRVIKKRQQSLLSRVASEIGVTGKASEYWNRIQGKIHPTFRANYDRHGATMS